MSKIHPIGGLVQMSKAVNVFFDWIDAIVEKAGKLTCYLVFIIMCITTIDVTARYVFNRPLLWGWLTNRLLFGVFILFAGVYTLYKGEHIRIEGCVIDADGRPVEDAMIEIWQANHHGRYNHPLDEQDEPLDPEFMGHGRTSTDVNGKYRFETIKPGSVPGPGNTAQAPHINVIVFARGMLSHAFTRIYFENEADNRNDPVLMGIEDEAHRNTLVARQEETAGVIIYRFDIRFQGEHETAFFDA